MCSDKSKEARTAYLVREPRLYSRAMLEESEKQSLDPADYFENVEKVRLCRLGR
jgi:hypothetical protein